MKNIAIISHWGFKSLHGGNLRSFFLIKELIHQKHNVTVLLADNNDVEHTQELFGCHAVSVNEPMSRWQPVFRKIFQYLIFGIKIRKYLNRHSFDAVFGINLIQALPIVQQRKSKSWIMYVDFWADFFEYDAKDIFLKKIISRAVRFAEFYTIMKADKIVMITDAMKKLTPQHVQDKIKIIPDGADTQRFKPENSKSKAEVLDKFNINSGPVLSYQGGIARHEGLDLLCHAAPYVLEKIPKARFLIVGRGEFLSHCKGIVKKKGILDAFVFTGWVDYAEMPKILAAVDVCVVPMPNVRASRPIISFKLLEAMASGTLVVANHLPGLSEIVNDKMVVFTTADDSKVFARDLIRACQLPPEKKNELTENALKRVAGLDWRNIAKRDADHFLN